jgi:hypothetical protein
MQRQFYCGVCGRKGCKLFPPAVDTSGIEPFPAGREVWMAGPRETGESFDTRDARVMAAYLSRWPTGDALGEFRGPALCNLYSVTTNKEAIRALAAALGNGTMR